MFYVGCYHFLIYVRLKSNREYLTFALACFVKGVYAFACAGLYSSTTYLEGAKWNKIEAFTLALLGVTVFLFVNDFTGRRIRKTEYIPLIYFTVTAPLPLFVGGGLFWTDKASIKILSIPFGITIKYFEVAPGILTQIQTIAGLLFGIYILFICFNYYRFKNRKRGRLLLISFFIYLASFANDMLLYNEVYSFIYLTEYSFIGIVLIFTFYLTDNIIHMGKMKEMQIQNEERYRILFDSSTNPISLIDYETGNIVDCNAASVELQGASGREDIIGLSPSSMSPEYQPDGQPSSELAERYMKEALRDGGKVFEWYHKKMDGSITYPIMVTLSPLIYRDKTYLMSITKDISKLKKTEDEKAKVIEELKEALENIKTLKGLLPICSRCKKIKDDKGYWNNLESYIESYSDALFTHSICSECSDELYSKESWYMDYKKKNK